MHRVMIYIRSTHIIELQDKGGHVTTVTQPFSLNTEPSSIGLFELLLLQANLPTGVSSHSFIIIHTEHLIFS